MILIIIRYTLKSVEVMGLGVRRFRQKLATVIYDCLASGLPGTGTRPDLRTSFDGGILAKAPGLSGIAPRWPVRVNFYTRHGKIVMMISPGGDPRQSGHCSSGRSFEWTSVASEREGYSLHCDIITHHEEPTHIIRSWCLVHFLKNLFWRPENENLFFFQYQKWSGPGHGEMLCPLTRQRGSFMGSVTVKTSKTGSKAVG
jgi:hypothetical protein